MDIKELEGGITTALNEATNEVFSTMLMMEVKTQDSFVKDEKNVSTDLISSLHFFGDQYMGKIAIFVCRSCMQYCQLNVRHRNHRS